MCTRTMKRQEKQQKFVNAPVTRQKRSPETETEAATRVFQIFQLFLPRQHR